MTLPQSIRDPGGPTGESGLWIRLFGRLELYWGLKPLASPKSPAAHSLLAYLIIRQGQPVSRDHLAGAFWPERSDEGARKALSQALWQVRSALGPAGYRLESSGDRVALCLQPSDWLDVAIFEEALQRCRLRLAGGALPAYALQSCLMDLNTAVELYRGDLVEECYHDWIVPSRERFLESYLWGLEQLIVLNKQWGDYDQALAHAQRLAATDPLRESAHCELMRLYHLLGRHRSALEQYASLSHILAKELGDKPAASTTALYQELLVATGEPLAAYLPLMPHSLGDLDRLPFVGRSQERAMLLEAAQAAARGQGGIILLEGPAGVGKTRLVEELAYGAEWRGLNVALGRAFPQAGAPYQPLTDALSPLLTPLRLSQLAELVEPYHLAALVPLFPQVSEALPGLPLIADLKPTEQQERLWEGLACCLVSLGMIAPLLLVLEDLHWAQPTLNALKAIAYRLEQSRVLLLLTCRTVEARQEPLVWETLQELDRKVSVQRLSLSPLTEVETCLFLQRALPAEGYGEEFAGRLWQETGGSPLLLIETLKSILKQSQLEAGPKAVLSFEKEASLLAGVSIQALTEARLRRLPPDQRQVLEAMAVLGEQSDFATIAYVTSGVTSDLIPCLGELERLGFLKHAPDGYQPGHELVRQGVYQSIPPARRQALHLRAGEALERDYPQRAEALAYHFEQGKEIKKALEYTLRAAGRAQDSLDYLSAIAYDERALLLLGDQPAQRWDVLAHIEQALDVLGSSTRHEQALDEMLRLAEELDDPRCRSETLCRQGKRLVLYGLIEQAMPRLDEAADLARQSAESNLLGQCLVWSAYGWFYRWDASRCQSAAQAALLLFQQTDDLAGEGQVQNLLGNLFLGLLGNHARALACFDRSRQIAKSLGNRHKENTALGNMGGAYSELGCFRESVELLEKAIPVMDQIGDRFRQGIFCCALARSYLGLGDLDRAQRSAEEALRIFGELGNDNWRWQALEALGMIALERGDLRAAQESFQQSLDLAEAGQEKADLSIRLAYQALVCLHRFRLEQALALSRRAVQTLEEIGEELARAREIYFIHFQVLSARQGWHAAYPYLERAHKRLLEEAASIEDEALRQSFRGNIPLNRLIQAAWESGRAPPVTIRASLPPASPPVGRGARPQEPVQVTWTLVGPQDGEIGSKVERRRVCLRRLLSEAQAQGTSAPLDDLASALNVDPRTIKRDLAALRTAGQAPSRRSSG